MKWNYQSITVCGVLLLVGLLAGYLIWHYTLTSPGIPLCSHYVVDPKSHKADIEFTVPLGSQAFVTSEMSGDASIGGPFNKTVKVVQVNGGVETTVSPNDPSGVTMHLCSQGNPSHAGWLLLAGSYKVYPLYEFGIPCNGIEAVQTYQQAPITNGGQTYLQTPSGFKNCPTDSYDFNAGHDDTHITLIMENF